MILCCGEALIDMLPCRTVDGEAAFQPYPGGAIFNSAIALGRLGAPGGFFCGLSSDFFGDMLRQALEDSHVDYSLCPRKDLPTTMAFVRIENAQASYLFYDENTASRMITGDELPVLNHEVSALLFGAISLISEPAAHALESLMMREAASRVIMLDPNIRPNFIKDRNTHLARMKRMMAQSDIIKLSDEDIEWFNEEGSHADIAARWLEKGPKIVIITKGSAGADAYTKDAMVHVPALPVTVVDTVGAGDTVNAGMLAGLHKSGYLNKSMIAQLPENVLHNALTLGMQAASISVSRAGANPPWRHELD